MRDSELKNERILEAMQEVLESAYADAKVTVLKADPPMVRVWKSDMGMNVTASIHDDRYCRIDISMTGRGLESESDSDASVIKLTVGLIVPYVLFRIWQLQETAKRELYTIPFLGISVVAVLYAAWGVISESAAINRHKKAFPVPETMRVQARLEVRIKRLLESLSPAEN